MYVYAPFPVEIFYRNYFFAKNSELQINTIKVARNMAVSFYLRTFNYRKLCEGSQFNRENSVTELILVNRMCYFCTGPLDCGIVIGESKFHRSFR